MRPWWLGKTCPIELIKKWGDKMDHSNRATKRSRWIDTNKGTSWIIYQTGTSWMGLQKRDQLNQVTERDMCYCWGQFPPTCWMWAMLCVHFITLHVFPQILFTFLFSWLSSSKLYASNSPPANSLRSALCTQSTALNAEGQVNIEMGRNVPTASTYHNHDDHVDASDDRKSPLLKYIFLYVSFDIFLCIYLSLYVSLKKKEEEKSDLRKHLDCFVIFLDFSVIFFLFL